jgi:hypothetical protein
MPIKNSDAASAKPAAKTKSGPDAIISEPRADWQPLWLAPFFCASDGLMHSTETWQEVFYDEVRKIASILPPEFGHNLGPTAPEWSFERAKDGLSIFIGAMGVETQITPGSVWVSLENLRPDDFPEWLHSAYSNGILNRSDWDDVPENQRLAVRWHRALVRMLIGSLGGNLKKSFLSGAVHIMARKNSVLAPFERVTADQWYFFKLDDDKDNSPSKIWYDPRNDGMQLSTATGPAGERLYAIYVAPGVKRDDNLTVEEECRQWLRDLMRDYPNRPPVTLERLAEEAVSKFPGLSKRGFFRCFSYVQEDTKNRNWSRAGAPKKSRQKSPRNN